MDLSNIVFCSIYICILIIAVTLQQKGYRSLRTPISLFSVLWCVVGFCTNLPIFGYYPPSDMVNLCIIFGSIIFMSVFIGKRSTRIVDHSLNSEWIGEMKINKPMILGINAVCWMLLFPQLQTAWGLITSNGFAFVRANLSNTVVGLSRGGLFDIAFAYMIEPVFSVTAIIASIQLLSGKKSKSQVLFFVYSMISILLYSITSAGRGTIVKVVFYIVLIAICFKGKVINTLWRNKIIRTGLIFAAVVVLFITSERAGGIDKGDGIENTIKTFYIYYFSGPGYMTRLLEAQPTYALGGKLLWGSATFGFIYNWFAYALLFLGGPKVLSDYTLGTLIANQYYNVAPTVKINAMYTCFYSFILDWGYLGIVIGPMLLAVVSKYLYNQTYAKCNCRAAVVYITWLYILIRTVFKLDTLTISYGVTLACVFLFIRRENGTKRT